MTGFGNTAFLALAAAALGLSSCGPYHSDEDNKRFQAIISSIRMSPDPDFQDNEARSLYRLLKGRTCDEVDGRTMRELVSLLDIRHDGIRLHIVRALGRLPPCARAAIPKLKEILPEADCWPSGLRSGGYIHHTLEKLGELPIPDAICTGPAEGYIPSIKS
jgi:hypothetical protein